MDTKKFSATLGKTGDFLVQNKKSIFIVATAVVVVGVVYAVTKGATGAISGFFKSGKQTGASDFKSLAIDPSKTSINEEQANNYANQLYNAMNGGWSPIHPIVGVFTGTNKTAIENVFKKLNSEDYKMVYNAFGRKSYNRILGTTNELTGVTRQFENLDLTEWLISELDFLDFSLKNKLRPIITGAGFAF